MRKFIFLLIFFILMTNFLGCASFRRKFVREKKKEERPHPVVYFENYTENISFHDLYKKHFLFWKYWEMELINALEEDNYKKQLTSLQQAIASLKNLESYLVPEKQKEIVPYRETLEKIEPEIRKGFISELGRMSLKRRIEKHLRVLEKELMYSKMSEFIREK